MEQMHRELEQLRTEREQLWRETVQLRHNEEQLSTEAVQLRSTAQRLQKELDQTGSETSQTQIELYHARAEADKLREAMRIKDDEIAFLRGHVSQLTQQITPALPPSQEEARSKAWWQFWRRGRGQ
jgi:chromosome segregation ATPase